MQTKVALTIVFKTKKELPIAVKNTTDIVWWHTVYVIQYFTHNRIQC